MSSSNALFGNEKKTDYPCSSRVSSLITFIASPFEVTHSGVVAYRDRRAFSSFVDEIFDL